MEVAAICVGGCGFRLVLFSPRLEMREMWNAARESGEVENDALLCVAALPKYLLYCNSPI